MPTTHSSHKAGWEVHPHAGGLHVLRTWLRAEGASGVLSTVSGPTLRVAGAEVAASPPCWPVDALLLGAVEAGVRADFIHRAERDGLPIAFYESTAQARWSEGEHGPDLLDVTVQPRVGVHQAADVGMARDIFAEVGVHCLVARALRAPLALQPTVEVWRAKPSGPGGERPND